ncbi:hypothetical protein PPERSA_04310 [Pseudocohnilembus persalinus]|uniref:Uncharacterized protein n=1 Tax=Pseudocohnilembus persalinus TaxID=266149 RepID=A0A0V0QP05_PSEPJ|nr:hypothetical protein PPERSA_04310 [Pseudocohnilembus persalinus]|eukprot:KRX03802.1 hypothetical protein PPERSA_04310 [Pseudocohnilembus persalinus]
MSFQSDYGKIEQLEGEVDKLRKTLMTKEKDFNKETAILKQKNELMQMQIQDFKKREENFKKMNETIMETLNDLSSNKQPNQNLIKEIHSILESHSQNSICAKYKHVEKIEELKDENSRLVEILNQHGIKVTDSQVIEGNASIQSYKNLIVELQQKIDKVEKEKNDILQKVDKAVEIEEEIKQLKKKFQDELDYQKMKYEQDIQNYEKKLEKNQSIIKKYQGVLEKNPEEISQYKEKIKQLENKLKEEENAHESILNKTIMENDELSQKCKKLEYQLRNFCDDATQMKSIKQLEQNQGKSLGSNKVNKNVRDSTNENMFQKHRGSYNDIQLKNRKKSISQQPRIQNSSRNQQQASLICNEIDRSINFSNNQKILDEIDESTVNISRMNNPKNVKFILKNNDFLNQLKNIDQMPLAFSEFEKKKNNKNTENSNSKQNNNVYCDQCSQNIKQCDFESHVKRCHFQDEQLPQRYQQKILGNSSQQNINKSQQFQYNTVNNVGKYGDISNIHNQINNSSMAIKTQQTSTLNQYNQQQQGQNNFYGIYGVLNSEKELIEEKLYQLEQRLMNTEYHNEQLQDDREKLRDELNNVMEELNRAKQNTSMQNQDNDACSSALKGEIKFLINKLLKEKGKLNDKNVSGTLNTTVNQSTSNLNISSFNNLTQNNKSYTNYNESSSFLQTQQQFQYQQQQQQQQQFNNGVSRSGSSRSFQNQRQPNFMVNQSMNNVNNSKFGREYSNFTIKNRSSQENINVKRSTSNNNFMNEYI